MKKEFLSVGIKIKTDIFPDGIRPNHVNPMINGRALSVIIHYPKQIWRAKWWKNHWPIRDVNSSKSYATVFNIKGMEVVRYRNKRDQKCYENFPDYDEENLQQILLSVGCRPPYAVSRYNLRRCTEPDEMKKIVEKQTELWSGDNLRHLPCAGIEKVSYAAEESDEEKSNPPFFKITFLFKDLSYKEIKMVADFDFQALVGNVGGYIGLFLGYALMMIPQCLRGIGTRMQHRFEKRKQTGMTDEMKTERNDELKCLRIQVDKISKTISDHQIQMQWAQGELFGKQD
jgi:hypothetical protein